MTAGLRAALRGAAAVTGVGETAYGRGPADRSSLTLQLEAALAAVRDAGLDRYLAAHRSLASGAVAAGAAEQRMHIVFEAK